MSETTKRNSELVDVSYEIRNQVKLVPGEKTDGGSKMFDLYLKEPYYFETLSFLNFYTGYLTIKARQRPTKDSTGDGWKTLLDRFQLMPNVNAEPGANDFFTIRQDMLMEKKMKNVSQLRFLLYQPSTYWKDFSIDNIKLTIHPEDVPLDKVLDDFAKKCERFKKINFEKLPPIEIMSNRLQNMWLLCHEASRQDRSESEDCQKFDSDGSYDVNILAYNSSSS